MDKTLLPFFQPTGIVVLGVSTSSQKLGYGVARNLKASGYRGPVHLVGQRAGELFGQRVYSTIADIPGPADLAVIVVPAAAVAATIQQCGARGTHAAIVLSAGFRETGPAGAALERECLEQARIHGVRLLGPNCIGIIDTHFPFDTSFLQPPMPPKGGIAFVSQSGALCAAVVDWSRGQGFGFSKIVSLGNQADIDEAEILAGISEDHKTRVIALYMEGVADGKSFMQEAGEVARNKPIVAMKVGRSEPGRKAVSSHTAALAGSDAAFEAAFAKCGILRAATAEQLFDWARALEQCPLPAGRRVAILTDAGGPGVMAADALEAEGMQLAALGPTTRQALAAGLPAAASAGNPVDMLASASPRDYARCLSLLLDADEVDSVLVILPPPPMYTAESVAEEIIPIIQAARKPVTVALLGSHLTAMARDAFLRAEIPTYPFPERAASSLAVLARRAQFVSTPPMAAVTRPFEAGTIAASGAEHLLRAYGIRVQDLRLAISADSAAAIAVEIGFPVVLKIASPDIIHKSDIGGIMLDIRDPAAAAAGYRQLMESVHARMPQANLEGVHIQGHISEGQEVIMGGIRDPQFGPLVMFGSGGIEAEALRDVAFALAPLGPAEADGLMERTWAGRRLAGFRGMAPVDRAAALDALVRLSWLMHEHSELLQIEINPLRVTQEGAIALDVRSSQAPPAGRPAQPRMV